MASKIPGIANRELSAFLTAAKQGKDDIVTEYLDKYGDAIIDAGDITNDPALAIAAQWGRESTIALLLKRGAAIEKKNNDGRTPLIIAAVWGLKDDDHRATNLAAVKLLLDAGADIEARDKRGETALMLAARDGYADVVGFLLENGASLDTVNNEGHTASVVAGYAGQVGIKKFLKQKELEAEIRDFSPSIKQRVRAPKGLKNRLFRLI